jgi:hypothetical protein
MMDEDIVPIYLDTDYVEKREDEDCASHVLCNCICHSLVSSLAQHRIPCCSECPYCLQNVIYTRNNSNE